MRDDQAFPDDDAVHALLTVKGLSGSVLLMQPIHTENAINMAEALGTIRVDRRSEVYHMCVRVDHVLSVSHLVLIDCL